MKSSPRPPSNSQPQDPSIHPQVIQPATSPKPLGPYSHAVRQGDLLFCSGQVPVDSSGQLVPGGIQEQTRQVLQNLQLILQDQSLSFRHVLKTTVFMTNLQDFPAMNEVYAAFFSSHHPARSTVQVAALPKGAQIEIEAIAGYVTL